MFGAVLSIATTLLLAYVVWRASSVPLLARHLSRRGFLTVGVGLWAVVLLAQVLGHGGTGLTAAILEPVGMVVLGALFLVATALLVVDVATGFGFVLRKWAPTLRGWGMAAGAVLTVVALVQGARAPEVVAYDVTLPSLPAGLDGRVLVAMSDAHLGAQLEERWLNERVSEVEALRPDLVVFLGDMFEGHGGVPPELPALVRLQAPMGKWFVDGNHESHRDVETGTAVLEAAGFHRLANEAVELAPGLVLAGVNDLTNHRRRALDGDPLSRALGGRPAGATVLLSHTPWEVERAASAGVELMLSGHTHGGQIWPFGLLVARVYPLVAGRYDVDGMPIIVSRGAGTWGPRMRLWHRGEIVKVTLRAVL